MKIAILGATSHIAKGLTFYFSKESDVELFLFGRNVQKIREFLDQTEIECEKVYDFESLDKHKYDAIVNCVGYGDPARLKESNDEFFRVTEYYDNLIIDLIKKNPETLYVNLSSGAVYGTGFEKPVSLASSTVVSVNQIEKCDYYRISKLYSEAKHRSLVNYNIVDLRVFNYFSRFINMDSKYLITELVNSIIDNREFVTNEVNIVRDYVDPSDLFQLIMCCIKKKQLNTVYDVYSKKSISKFEMLDALKDRYNLKVKINESLSFDSATGIKSIYFSENNAAADIGYKPVYSSIESILSEISYLLK